MSVPQVGHADGNQALALLLLVVSNLLGIVTSQLWLKAVLSTKGGVPPILGFTV